MSDILCIGICTVDAIARTVNEYPPPGGLRLFNQLTVTTGGCAVNCSIALAKMGVPCALITKVGSDMLGRFVLEEARRHRIDTSGVICDQTGTTTPFTFVCVHEDGQRSFIHTMGTNATLRLDEIDMGIVQRCKFCFVAGTMIMTALDGKPTAELLRQARQAGAKTLLDTVYVDAAANWREVIEPALPQLDYFVPSEPEAAAISGLDDPAEMARYFQDKGCRNVVIKLGHAGAFWRDADGNQNKSAAFAVDKVIDTTGAGDCWCAGFLAGLQRGERISEAVDLGNAAAAFCIQAPGASTGIKPLKKILQFRTVAERAC